VTDQPLMFWTLNPTDKRTHAVVLGDVEALCGVVFSAMHVRRNRPWGDLCMPCVIGATADLPDPGPGGGF
jgi:hypothetical protein